MDETKNPESTPGSMDGLSAIASPIVAHQSEDGSLWGITPRTPFTIADLEAVLSQLTVSKPRTPYRVVSASVYERAEAALADGAGPREVEYILMGASRAAAKKWAEGK